MGDLFQWICENGSSADFVMFLMIFWSISIAQNDQVLREKKQSCSEALDRASRVKELYFLNPDTVCYFGHINLNSRISFWQKPPPGVLKLNVDVAVFKHLDLFGVGLVARDNSGSVVCAQGKINHGSFNPLLAELVVIKTGILSAIGMGLDKFIIESDALLAVQAIDNYNSSSMETPVIDFIRSLILNMDNVSIIHCFRNANHVAHLDRRCIFSLVKTSNFCLRYQCISNRL